MPLLTRITLPNGALFNQSQTFVGAGSLFGTGTVYFVSSGTGSNDNAGTDPSAPKATIAGAQSVATANKGDIVVVMPGHAETFTSSLTLSKAGVSYIGLGRGSLAPTLTGNGTIDCINVTGANITIDGFRFPAPETDDQTADINVAAAGCLIQNTFHIGSQTSKNKTDIITIASGGDDCTIQNVYIENTIVDAVSAISVEAAVTRFRLYNSVIVGSYTTGCLMDEATATLMIVRGNVMKNTKTTGAVITFTTGNSTGVCSFNHLSGRNTTLASNTVTGTGMDFFENRVVEEAALNGAISPAADTD